MWILIRTGQKTRGEEGLGLCPVEVWTYALSFILSFESSGQLEVLCVARGRTPVLLVEARPFV